MVIDLTNVRMGDRFTHKIKVHPRKWSLDRPPHKFRLILLDNGKAIRCSHHPFIEDVEHSIREFLEMYSDGDWEIHDYKES